MAKRAPSARDRIGLTVWVGGALPLVMLGYRAFTGTLGAEPVAIALNQLGLLALVLLLSSLACTPIKIVTRATWPIAVRRALGLLGFFYATLHVATYVAIDQGFDVAAILEDVTSRPFTIVGALAWLSLLPLALTSSKRALQTLGAVRWRRLHRLAYLCGVLAVAHFTLRVKKDYTEPAVYGLVLAALLGLRVFDAIRRRRASKLS